MPANTMTIADCVEAAQLLPPERSVCLRGDHGVGKSQVVRRIAKLIAKREGLDLIRFDARQIVRLVKEKGEDALKTLVSKKQMAFIDCRLGQMSDGDVIGLPEGEHGITWFNPPVWFRLACEMPCIVFLDEINRATLEVMQASFQVCLDHEIGGHPLHPLSRVLTALNDGSQYQVNEMDPALQDRFWTVDLRPTWGDWDRWAGEANPEKKCGFNILPLVRAFIAAEKKWLDTKKVDPGDVTTSRRSWEHLSDSLSHADLTNPNQNVFFNIAKGFVGFDAATTFVAFAKTFDAQVTGEEVLRSYATDPMIKERISNMGTENLNTIIDRVCTYVLSGEVSKLGDKMGSNLRSFMKDLPSNELRANCWTQLTKSGVANATMIKSVHKHISDLVTQAFGVDENEILDKSSRRREFKASA